MVQDISTPSPTYFTSRVPQAVYRSQGPHWRPLPPIHFTTLREGGRREGINLEDVLNNRYVELDSRFDPMFEDESIGSTVICRLNVCGHFHDGSHRSRPLLNSLILLVRGIPRVRAQDETPGTTSMFFHAPVLDQTQQTDLDKEPQDDTRPNYSAGIGALCRQIRQGLSRRE